jgi:tetratricopeptide (TPR) repeat protein
MAAAVLVAASLSVFSIVKRNAVWHDDLALFTDAVRLSPNIANLHSNLGFAYWARRDPTAAIEQWHISIALDPDNYWALNDMGMAKVAEKRYADAIPELQHAIKLRPGFAGAHSNLADAFQGLGREHEAESEYQAAIDSSPLDYDAHNQLGAFYRKVGKIAEARNQYLLSFAAEPNADALDGLGDIAMGDGQTALAENYFRRAVDVDSEDHHAHYELVLLYGASGRVKEALREFELGQKTDVGTDPLSKEAEVIVDKLKNAK